MRTGQSRHPQGGRTRRTRGTLTVESPGFGGPDSRSISGTNAGCPDRRLPSQPFSCSKQDRGAKIRTAYQSGAAIGRRTFFENGLHCASPADVRGWGIEFTFRDPHSVFCQYFQPQPPTLVTLVFRPILIPKERLQEQNRKWLPFTSRSPRAPRRSRTPRRTTTPPPPMAASARTSREF